ncbi:hypothetical protein NEF87_000212 [Candidatus Lokiarchaeum ossiferum]|uniref:Phospholipase D-like domain-containing protein n=1 Tax=Candidatus Lokiarchaeum ossiferum TaxID=2951803 RepID=A0ABY6HNF3_9ARCH|nr:hypothetical protein NEF87_000212 [Candidatus Lokiarchaeum sp. B-35]
MVKVITETDGVTAEILSIIKRARKELMIVSPYIQLDGWPRLNDALKYVLNDNEKNEIEITIITRNQPNGNNKSLDELSPYLDRCRVYVVDDLHSKVYYNETTALVTSMNMYQHSAEKNHEIGVLFEERDKVLDVREHIKYLMSAGQKTVSEKKKNLEETTLAKNSKEQFSIQKFMVLSKGNKWIKVETDEGYENKILIANAPGLKDGSWYEAEVIKNWNRTKYGLDVEYTQIKNIRKIQGNCIICGEEIELDPTHPMCKPCYFKNKKYRGSIFGKQCHICGTKQSGITDSKPLCKDCYYAF